jgi:EmrB/QacA subfamily drug resistance transporter
MSDTTLRVPKQTELPMQNGNPAHSHVLRGRILGLALLSAAALFMENLDATIMATGLPAMARDFGVTPVALNVGITAYLLALAVFIPISGWMAGRFGERRVFASAVLIFTVASVFCGVSRNLPAFLLSRILQGLGGSMMVPVGRLMLVRAVTKPQLMGAIAYTIWPALTAPILGPVVGGYILHVASWPWMFLLNVPIGVVLFVVSLFLVRDSAERSTEPLDGTGYLLVVASCLLLMLGLERVQMTNNRFQGSLLQAAVAVAASAGMAAIAAWHMRRVSRPLFQMEVFRIKSFRTVIGSGSLFRMAVFSAPFLLPLLFQTSFGLDALRSGSLVTAVFAGNLAMKPLTTPILRRFGFRLVLLGNGVATVLLLAACGWLRVGTSTWLVLIVLFLGGAGRSMEFTALTTLGFADLPLELTNSGTTLITVVQQMTVSVGIAVAALTLQWSTHLGHAVGDFRITFLVMSGIAAVSLPAFYKLPHDAGAAVNRPQRLRSEQNWSGSSK